MSHRHCCTDPACRVRLTLHVDGPKTYGDLHVCGFVTERTATDVGMDFADALRSRHPGADVSTVVEKLARRARPDAATLREQIEAALESHLSPPASALAICQADAVMAVLAEHGLIDNNGTTGDET